MKVFELRPAKDPKDNDNPWEPWFNKCFGFIIRAETEAKARKIAHENAGEENRGEFLNKKITKTKSPWLDKKYSTCIEVASNGNPGIIMEDIAKA